jgi:hypothetical protein
MDEHSIDLVRDALQVHVNEAGAAAGNGGWFVAHYIVVAGLYRVNDDGTTETRPIVTAPLDQADYITDGLLSRAPDLLAACEDCEDCDDDALGE